jgi:hypothetical protein
MVIMKSDNFSKSFYTIVPATSSTTRDLLLHTTAAIHSSAI